MTSVPCVFAGQYRDALRSDGGDYRCGEENDEEPFADDL